MLKFHMKIKWLDLKKKLKNYKKKLMKLSMKKNQMFNIIQIKTDEIQVKTVLCCCYRN